MKLKIREIFMLIFLFGFLTQTYAQLESLLERYTGQNAEGYIEPLVTAVGAGLNSGLYRTAKVPESGLHINIGFNAMATMFSDNQKTFTATTEGYFRPVEEVETPTVVGSGKGATVMSEYGTAFTFPGGYELNSFALAAPIVTVGSIMGTEASLRYFKANINEDLGDLTLVGLGARHSISQYIPLSPVDISAGFFYHNIKLGDILKTNLLSFYAVVGKSFPVINVYGGLAMESNKADINYTFTAFGQQQDISLSVTGKNKFRALAGVGINLLMLHLNVDYNLGHQSILNAGLSFGL